MEEVHRYRDILRRLIVKSREKGSTSEKILYDIQRVIWLMDLDIEKEQCLRNFEMTQSFENLLQHSDH